MEMECDQAVWYQSFNSIVCQKSQHGKAKSFEPKKPKSNIIRRIILRL